MVKENGMVMMSEEEYSKMKKEAENERRELEHGLDIALMELSTYFSSMKKIAKRNLDLNPYTYDEKPIEMPVKDFAGMIEKIVSDVLDDDDLDAFDDINRTDFWFVWNGFCARLPHTPEIHNTILPAIVSVYEEINQ